MNAHKYGLPKYKSQWTRLQITEQNKKIRPHTDDLKSHHGLVQGISPKRALSNRQISNFFKDANKMQTRRVKQKSQTVDLKLSGIFLLVPGAGQPYLLRPFRYGNKFQCLCNLLIMACYQKYALFINFWFCIWFCIRLSDKERMRLQHFRVLFCRDLDILHKVRFLFVPCNLHNGNSWNPGLICVCSE